MQTLTPSPKPPILRTIATLLAAVAMTTGAIVALVGAVVFVFGGYSPHPMVVGVEALVFGAVVAFAAGGQ